MNGSISWHISSLLTVLTKRDQRISLCLSINLISDKWVALKIGCAPKTAMPAVRQVKLGPFPSYYLLKSLFRSCFPWLSHNSVFPKATLSPLFWKTALLQRKWELNATLCRTWSSKCHIKADLHTPWTELLSTCSRKKMQSEKLTFAPTEYTGGVCACLSVCVSPHKFKCWKAHPQDNGIRRQGLWEVLSSSGWSPHNWN